MNCKQEINLPFKILEKVAISNDLFQGDEIFPMLESSFNCLECQKEIKFEIIPFQTGYNINTLHRNKIINIEYLMKHKVGTLTYQNGLEIRKGLEALYIKEKCDNCASDYLIVFGCNEIQNGIVGCKFSGIWKIIFTDEHF